MNPRRRQYDAVVTSDEHGRRHKPDYLLPVIASMLLGIGVIMLVAISPALSAQNGVPGSYYVSRQLIAMAIGFALFMVMSRLSLRSIKALRWPLVSASVIAAGLVLAISGIAFRWIQIGGLSFQPAELIKFTIIILGAFFLADRVRAGEHQDTKKTLWPVGIWMGIAAFITVILERDLGSMVVMVSIIVAMLLLANVPVGKLFLIMVAVGVLAGLAVASTPYRRERLSTFLQPERDCSSTGYHACQALIAVGSGGVFGLGLGNSVQAYGYLPEAANDSIFAIYAEKFGFIGSFLLLGLYGVLFARILAIVRRAPDMVSRLIGAGVLAWLGIQSMINIGAMIGLLPLKGITLPFVSYGGTSLMFVMAALGLVFRTSGYTVMRRSLQGPEQAPSRSSASRRMTVLRG